MRLSRVDPAADPGLRRVGSPGRFRYVDDEGAQAPAEERRRITALVIPPAWTDVWICADPRGHIQAVGTDEAGRRQYLYHPRWRGARDRNKYLRALALAEALPRARARVTTSLRHGTADRERVLAVSFRLLDAVAPRIGSERYARRHGSRGLTTLQRRHAIVRSPVLTLTFPGKSGVRARLEIEDPELSAVVADLVPGRSRAPLLWYADGRRHVGLTPSDVNAYVRELTGGAFTAKDFRTLRGTLVAAQTLAHAGPARNASARKRAERLAAAATADALGNTPAVARSSYIDPRVFHRYRRGLLLDLSVSPETAIRRLLAPRHRRR